MMKVYWSPNYVGRETTMETVNKSQWIVDSLSSHPIDGVTLVAPDLLTRGQVRSAHSRAYVDALRTGRPNSLASSGLTWDRHAWTNVRATNGGVLAALREAIATGGASGSLSSGLHHARHGHGAGFCAVNGLAIAALAVLDEGLVDRVLILDVDGHGGGGTESIVRRDTRVLHLDVSTCHFDLPPVHDLSWGWLVRDEHDYLLTVTAALDAFDAARVPGERWAVLYNAGMDADADGATLAARESMVFAWARRERLPIAFALAGGYLWDNTPSSLVDLHRMTLDAAAGHVPTPPRAADLQSVSRV